MTEQMCLTHWVMACGVPEIVTALSVESGSMSPATWTWAPVVLTSPDKRRNKAYLLLKRARHRPKLKCCFKHLQITPNTFWHAGSSCNPNSNVCSNIWRGVHKYCPFRMSLQPLPIFTGIISGIFMSSNQRNTHILKQRQTRKVWLECLILEVSEHRGGGFLSLFGCRKTTPC